MKRAPLICALICLSTLIFAGCSTHPTQTATFPFVKIQDSIFVLDEHGTTTTTLPDTYGKIGTITAHASSTDIANNGSSSCCQIGDDVYQSSANAEEVFVYTQLFSDDSTYRYVKFCKAQ